MTQSISPAGQLPAHQATQTVTVEHLLYAAILLAAIGVRFVGLADEPLSPAESAAAWPAWLAATQTTVAGAPAPASALLYGFQSLLFWIAGGSDFLARIVPALASTATVMLPWFWRAWLGRWAALIVALLFAVDPWLTAWGRRADGSALALLLGLLAITAIWHWRHAATDGGVRRWERTGAVALGLLLTSGPLAWGMLPLVLIFAAIYVWPGGDRAQPLQCAGGVVRLVRHRAGRGCDRPCAAPRSGRRAEHEPLCVVCGTHRRKLPTRRPGPSCAW